MNQETVEKRMKDFQKIAENWDKLPERTRGRLEGSISVLETLFPDEKQDKKIG